VSLLVIDRPPPAIQPEPHIEHDPPPKLGKPYRHPPSRGDLELSTAPPSRGSRLKGPGRRGRWSIGTPPCRQGVESWTGRRCPTWSTSGRSSSWPGSALALWWGCWPRRSCPAVTPAAPS